MTPLEINIALHYWTTPTPWKGCSSRWTELEHKIVQSMQEARLVEYQGLNLTGNTPAMRAYVEALCDVQWPQIRWVVPTSPRVVRDSSEVDASP